MKHLTRLVFCTLAVVSASRAGTIIYSTDGTDTPGYRTNSFWGAGAGYNPSISMRFTAAATDSLASITVAASYPGFATTFEIAADSSNAPGTVLDTFTILGTGSAGEYAGNSTSNPVLTAGTAYWLEMIPPSSGTAYWFVSNPGVGGEANDSNITFVTNGGLGAFSLEGPAPEPGTIALFFTAIVGCLGRKVLRGSR